MSTPVLAREEMEAVECVLRSGRLAQGAKVEEFEASFASYIGTKYAIATSSGTAALHIAFLASGIGHGDEVITTPFSFIATANAILFCGARPVFVDIDKDTFCINPGLIRAKITSKTKAVLPVHLYGQPCNMKEIVRICREHNLILIEDACQAHGAEYSGKKVGSFGIGCFSFYPTKNMTTGEGGMILTADSHIAERARMIRSHGQNGRYVHELLGYNYRMTDIAAAIGICQLKKLDEFNRRRIEHARFLTETLSNFCGLITPFVTPDVKHVFHQFTIKVTGDFAMSRDELKQRLKDRGIMTEVYYPLPIHKQPLYKELGYNVSMPNAGKACAEVLSLPVHPLLTEEELDYIIETIRNI
ncbi:MAG: DegT/DnrJ/EryC1/StrS family aminotransferase [Dehalococcoidia bacterium]